MRPIAAHMQTPPMHGVYSCAYPEIINPTAYNAAGGIMFFKGYYFKHQCGDDTVAFIPGIADSGAFIQVITNKGSRNYSFNECRFGSDIRVGKCAFGRSGINLDTAELRGTISYGDLTPLRYDIMGPFAYLPMQCRHGVISMRHSISGSVVIEGESYNLDGGIGYIEKDSGRSFPQRYLWLQCSDFPDSCSIMLSIASIPFLGFEFMGCICAIVYRGKEYRFATYLGVKIERCDDCGILISQGKFKLEVNVIQKESAPLYAPQKGIMSGIIRESNNSFAHIRLYESGSLVFDLHSNNASFEYNM